MEISIDEIVENDDGSATMHVDMDKETADVFLRKGIQLMIDESEYAGKVVLLLPEQSEALGLLKKDPEQKTWDLSDEENAAFIEYAMVRTLEESVKKDMFLPKETEELGLLNEIEENKDE